MSENVREKIELLKILASRRATVIIYSILPIALQRNKVAVEEAKALKDAAGPPGDTSPMVRAFLATQPVFFSSQHRTLIN